MSRQVYGAIVRDPKGDRVPYLDASTLRWTVQGVQTAWQIERERGGYGGKELVEIAEFLIEKV